MATALAHLNDRIPRLSSRVRGVPPALERLVNDLLAKDPNTRVPSAVALRERLDALGPIQGGNGGLTARVGSGTPATSRARVDEASARARAGTRTVAKPRDETSVLEGATSVTTTNGLRPPSAGPSAGGAEQAAGAAGDGTVALLSEGPSTDPFGPNQMPSQSRRGSRTTRRVGIVVASLFVVGAITAAAVLAGSANRHPPPPPGGTPSASGAPKIEEVVVFMTTATRPPDNPSMARFTFDGDPSTYWPTDQYSSPTFGNLYPGIGLAIRLNAAEQGRQLVVTSPTSGWSAQAYLSNADIPSGRPVTDWGLPTDTKSNVAAGTATFDLGARRSQWVLLWITNLGPSNEARIAELSVR
jgi:hypothetical protein